MSFQSGYTIEQLPTPITTGTGPAKSSSAVTGSTYVASSPDAGKYPPWISTAGLELFGSGSPRQFLHELTTSENAPLGRLTDVQFDNLTLDDLPLSGTPSTDTFARGDGSWATLPTRLPPGGRLTLTTNTPVITSDVSSSTTIYYTPYVSDMISLWDGFNWNMVVFSETTLSLGTIADITNYDVFGYLSSGVLALELLAWTNNTTRATGISIQDGRYCKTGDKTRLYLGTFRTISTTTTCDTVTQRFVWNMYNRVPRLLYVVESANSWTYTTASFRMWNDSLFNKVTYVAGLSELFIRAEFTCNGFSTTTPGAIGIGVDSTTANSALAWTQGNAANQITPFHARYMGYPGLGFHQIGALEKGGTGCTFYGDNGGSNQGGLTAEIMG